QLEVGAVPSAFEDRSRALELALCQRYYSKSWDPDVDAGAATEAGSYSVLFDQETESMRLARFAVPMRVPPTVALYPPVGGAPGRVRVGDAIYDVLGMATVSRSSLGRVILNGFTGTSPTPLEFHFTADAEI
ncbi:MAG: hypothetical protein AAFP86_08310, partial [Planctomycetota bacterium]